MISFGKYTKAITAVVGGLIGWANFVVLSSGGFHHITAAEWMTLVIAMATALGVYGATNTQTQGP